MYVLLLLQLLCLLASFAISFELCRYNRHLHCDVYIAVDIAVNFLTHLRMRSSFSRVIQCHITIIIQRQLAIVVYIAIGMSL